MPIIQDVELDVAADGDKPSQQEKPVALVSHEDEDDDDDIDESLAERFIGLREMFPDCVRNGTHTAITSSWGLTKWLYATSRTALWVVGSSATLLALPAILENERQTYADMEVQQQRELLLGPTAAASARGSGMMPQQQLTSMPMPPTS